MHEYGPNVRAYRFANDALSSDDKSYERAIGADGQLRPGAEEPVYHLSGRVRATSHAFASVPLDHSNRFAIGGVLGQ
jgi:hypothetical protein